MSRSARVLVHLVDDDTGKQLVLPIGRIPIADDAPPLITDLLALMKTVIDRVETGRAFRDIVDAIGDLG